MAFMDYAGSGLQGAAQGAAAGSLLGPPGAVIGGAIGLIGGVLNNPEDQQRRRYQQLLQEIQAFQRQQLGQGMGIIESQTANRVSAARSAAVRRAAAMGRSGNIEAIAQPIESNVADAGANAEERYIAAINAQAGQAALGAAQTYSQRPIQPSLGDTLLTAGQAYSSLQNANKMRDIEAGRVKSYQDYINAYTKSLENPTDVQPSAPTGEIPMTQGSDGTYYPSLRAYGRRLTFGNPSNSWMANY